MAIHEGKWRCKSCSRVNRGRDVGCEGCGEPRGEVDFFLDDDAPAVSDTTLIERAEAGADWICSYCGSSNVARAAKCNGCGGGRSEGKQRHADPVIPHRHHHVAPPPSSSALPKLLALVAAPVLLCGVFAMVLGTRATTPTASYVESQPRVTYVPPPPPPPPPPPRHVAAVVSTVSWERSIRIEQLRTFSEQGRSVPAGARQTAQEQVVDGYRDVKTGTRPVTKTRTVQTGTRTVTKTKRVQTGTRQVKTGTRSLGNGFFKDVYRSEPVYGTKTYTEQVPVYGPQTYTEYEPVYERRPVYATRYTYNVDRWVFDHDESARGDDLAPRWPEVTLGPLLREGGRGERVRVLLVADDGETFRYTRSTTEGLERFAPGARFEFDVQEGSILALHEAVAAVTTTR